jgi:hypothetical protein
MPPSKGPIWDHFLPGEKQNGSHIRAHCRGCIEKERPNGDTIALENEGNPQLLSQSWVIEGNFTYLIHNIFVENRTACKRDVGGVLGVKDPMVAHILGKGGKSPCPNASAEARKTAKKVKDLKGKREREVPGSESDDEQRPMKRKLLTKVKDSMKQTHLKVFRGIQVPFTEEQLKILHEQFLRATISANLPFRWVEDPEVITLFLLFRSTADKAIPSRWQLSGRLLDSADAEVKKCLKVVLQGEYAVLASDGWKDESRDSINGVNISISGKVSGLLVDGVGCNSLLASTDISRRFNPCHSPWKRRCIYVRSI